MILRHAPVARLVASIAVVLALIMGSSVTTAGAADPVDLATSLSTPVAVPVPHSPVLLVVSVDNAGTATATNVATEVTIPAGATIVDLGDECSAVAAVVTCTVGSVGPGEARGSRIFLDFASAASYTISSTADADQPDADGSTDTLVLPVIAENANLSGESDGTRIIAGTQSSYRVDHRFGNLGPTAVGQASVAGVVTGGGTIVPGSLSFVGDYFDHSSDLADDQCTVTATTFSCTPLFSAGVFYAVQPFIAYDVALPSTPAHVVATATITGRADPDTSNNVSAITIDVDAPKAEIYTQLVGVPGGIPSGQPFRVEGPVISTGDIAAQNVVAVLAVPTGWGIAVPPAPLPTGLACTILSAPPRMRCTKSSLASPEWVEIDAIVTPPAGSGTGTATLSVSTTTPEIGAYPNTATVSLRHYPFAGAHLLTVDPATGLAEGDTIAFHGVGFAESAPVFFCQGIVTGATPTAADCASGPLQSTTTDATGSFNGTLDVARFLIVNEVGVIDCAQPAAACGFGAADFFAPGGRAVITPLTFTTQPPVADPFDARISGTVTDADGNPLVGAPVWAYRATDTWVASQQTTTDASGSYVLEGAEPGIGYRILFGGRGSGLAPEWYGGPASPGVPKRAAALVVRLSAAAPVVDADVQLAPSGSLTGIVTGPTGAPVPNVAVWAYRSTDSWIGTYTAKTRADGTYTIAAPAGTQLRVRYGPPAGSGFVPEWFDGATSRLTATPITLSATTPVQADAQLSAGP